MAGEEADGEITLRWGDYALLVSGRGGVLMEQVMGSAEQRWWIPFVLLL